MGAINIVKVNDQEIAVPHGLGLKVFENGKVFAGQFNNGKIHGFGFLYNCVGK